MKHASIARVILEFYRWPVTSLRLSRRLIDLLIDTFDRSRMRYMLLLFPLYQLCSLVLSFVTVQLFLMARAEAFWWLAFVPLTFLLLIPAIASWHLSCFIFCKGYFDFFAEMGWPGLRLAVRFCDVFINEFRRDSRA